MDGAGCVSRKRLRMCDGGGAPIVVNSTRDAHGLTLDEPPAQPGDRAKPNQLELSVALGLGWAFHRFKPGFKTHAATPRKRPGPSNHTFDDGIVSVPEQMNRRRLPLIVVAPGQQPQQVADRLVPPRAQVRAGGGPYPRQAFNGMVEQCGHGHSFPWQRALVSPSERR